MKTLAKSLHTVTAIVRVASHLKELDSSVSNEAAVHEALDILGYPNDATLDPYDLTGAALKQLS